MEKEYVPFGEEWKKEMMKWNKKELIVFLKKTLIESKSDLAIEIDGVGKFLVPEQVFDLMIKTSKERDYYRDLVRKLEQMEDQPS